MRAKSPLVARTAAKGATEYANARILNARYPEYATLVRSYFDSAEHHGERLLGALIPNEDGKVRVAFEFTHFGPFHNGTFRTGKHLLANAVREWSDWADVSVLCTREAYEFMFGRARRQTR